MSILSRFERAAASVRSALGIKPRHLSDPEHPSATQNMLGLVFEDAHLKRATQIRIEFGAAWSHPIGMHSRLAWTCDVIYVIDGAHRIVMKPPGRMANDVLEQIDRLSWNQSWLPGENGAKAAASENEFSFRAKPDPLSDPPVPEMLRYRVQHKNENGRPVLVLTPV